MNRYRIYSQESEVMTTETSSGLSRGVPNVPIRSTSSKLIPTFGVRGCASRLAKNQRCGIKVGKISETWSHAKMC